MFHVYIISAETLFGVTSDLHFVLQPIFFGWLMTTNNSIDLDYDEDDDPTAELECLTEADSADIEADGGIEAVSNDRTFDFAGLEKDVKVLGELMDDIAEELKSSQKKQFLTSESLKKHDNEIESLRLQLSGEEQTRIDSARHRGTAHASTEMADANFESRELRLLVALNNGASREHPIGMARMSLGSDSDNDIQINSDFISRHHAQIVSSSTESVLGDLNSINGTYVNSKRIKRHALRDGDSITIGKHRFKYVKQNLQTSGS